MNWDEIEVKWAEMTRRVSGAARAKARVFVSEDVMAPLQNAAKALPDVAMQAMNRVNAA